MTNIKQRKLESCVTSSSLSKKEGKGGFSKTNIQLHQTSYNQSIMTNNARRKKTTRQLIQNFTYREDNITHKLLSFNIKIDILTSEARIFKHVHHKLSKNQLIPKQHNANQMLSISKKHISMQKTSSAQKSNQIRKRDENN